ncbi:Pyruvate/Phosphoenolpyruvate kinase-like domain-containing protein [Globomyces pollinis-pini]|nr:Pyruvate/Phosphoenolpyruvate kinase-like domain-containing protein [Globomyces pollinis-pini]
MNTLTTYQLKPTEGTPLVSLAAGSSVGSGCSSGTARIIQHYQDMKYFKDGEILVTNKTDPDWEPIMKRAGGIITNFGGRTCHAAIIARELGINAVVGCGNATEQIKTGQTVTISCSSGERGMVYDGLIPFDKKEIVVDNLPSTKTQIFMNIGNPEDAFRLSKVPCKGVGLARLEFIIANHVKVHPLALTQFDSLKDLSAKKEIEELTKDYTTSESKPEYFVNQLASGISLIAAAFYPRPVVIRMSDFKSNEYANLLGGQQFEPTEENPMIGWRGASRYYHANYREGFALECRAFKKVREEMGLKNVIPMIPFCRTPHEGELVIKEMEANGLSRKLDSTLSVYCMCEIPSNVLLANEFLNIFDGFSIGSNDLTQLTLGLDRDSEIISSLFDERSPAVIQLISQVIKVAKSKNKKIGICGQAPSDYPEFCRMLVKEGIDSISLNADTVIKSILDVAEFEKTL